MSLKQTKLYLHSIQVENYRAIKSGQLTFDESIAIIGENDSGKSSLLDALNKVLNPNNVNSELKLESHYFYHEGNSQTPNGFLIISLCFEEKKPGEWTKKVYNPIRNLISNSSLHKQRIILELRASLGSNNIANVKWSLLNPYSKNKTENTDTIQWVRRVNPIIMLSAGMLTGHGINNLKYLPQSTKQNTFPEELQSYVQEVHTCSEALLSGKSIHILSDIEAGYKAALKLNDYLTELPGFSGIKLKLRKELRNTTTGELSRSGSNSEKLGTLLIMHALIRACGNTDLQEVDPIWVLEDPEAHLHKITLATVSNIISGIKGQKIITTNSGGLLASFPIHQVRRLIRQKGLIQEFYLKEHALSKDDIRRVDYHVRTHRNSAFFSRVWLLVEGETEFWILPRLARILGYDFRLEGITCVEYAQSGLRPLIKIAEQLNIHWLMLTDGDKAGFKYANQAKEFVKDGKPEDKVCVFPARDIEQYLWQNGYDDVYIKHARTRIPKENLVPSRTVKLAVRNYSKPHLALSIIEAASGDNSPGVPIDLVKLIENCVKVARAGTVIS